ncbi:MAG TPA: hypothetical protein VGF24_33140 [Vicinamibacterales bacterium]|jgi:hypothetical protein
MTITNMPPSNAALAEAWETCRRSFPYLSELNCQRLVAILGMMHVMDYDEDACAAVFHQVTDADGIINIDDLQRLISARVGAYFVEHGYQSVAHRLNRRE